MFVTVSIVPAHLPADNFLAFTLLQSIRSRIGYDGTAQTPSVQLLKPTASSLGHRVASAYSRSQPAMSPPKSLRDPQKGANHADETRNIPRFDNSKGRGGIIAKTSFSTTPTSSPLDPFGKLNRSAHSKGATSDDDDDMCTQNSSSLLGDFDFDVEASPVGALRGPRSPQPQRSVLQRCSSWSPGSKMLQQYRDDSNRGLRERLRELRSSYNIDPVASQLLLQECAEHNEEGLGMHTPNPFSTAMEKVDAPKGSLFFLGSSSLPDVLRPASRAGRGRVAPITSEEAVASCPLSPELRDVSDKLLDVQTEDDIKSLARPVPQKFPPATSGFPRRSSLGEHHMM